MYQCTPTLPGCKGEDQTALSHKREQGKLTHNKKIQRADSSTLRLIHQCTLMSGGWKGENETPLRQKLEQGKLNPNNTIHRGVYPLHAPPDLPHQRISMLRGRKSDERRGVKTSDLRESITASVPSPPPRPSPSPSPLPPSSPPFPAAAIHAPLYHKSDSRGRRRRRYFIREGRQ